MSGGRAKADDPDALTTVGRYLDPVAAQLDRSRLEAEGITCFVQGGGLGSLLPTATVFPILLQVRAADAARATEVLAASPAADVFPADDESADRPDAGKDPRT